MVSILPALFRLHTTFSFQSLWVASFLELVLLNGFSRVCRAKKSLRGYPMAIQRNAAIHTSFFEIGSDRGGKWYNNGNPSVSFDPSIRKCSIVACWRKSSTFSEGHWMRLRSPKKLNETLLLIVIVGICGRLSNIFRGGWIHGDFGGMRLQLSDSSTCIRGRTTVCSIAVGAANILFEPDGYSRWYFRICHYKTNP